MLEVKQEPIEVEDEDDDELEALRIAALQTIRSKAQSPPRAIPSLNVYPDLRPTTVLPSPKKPIYRQHQANPNLIAIVPVNTTEVPVKSVGRTANTAYEGRTANTAYEKPVVHNRNPADTKLLQSLPLPQNRYCGSLAPVTKEEPKEVSTKFSRIDASDSESDDDNILLRRKNSSDEEDENKTVEDTKNNAAVNETVSNKEKNLASGFAALEDDDSLERLMDVMEQEFSEGPKAASVKKITKKKSVDKLHVKEDVLKVKVKQEKVDDGYEENKLIENVEVPKNVAIKKEIVDESYVDNTAVENIPVQQMDKVQEPKIAIVPSLQGLQSTSLSDNKITSVLRESNDLKKKNPLEKVNSSAVASPLRIRSPGEVNSKFLKQVPSDSSTSKHVYTNLVNNNDDDSNMVADSSNINVSNLTGVIVEEPLLPIRDTDPLVCTQRRSSPALLNYVTPSLTNINDKPGNELDTYRNSRSPVRIRGSEFSPIRRSLSPRRKDLSPRRYVSPRSRGSSPRNRSFSPRRRSKDFSPRRISPRRYSRSPVPYSASPSPVGRWHSRSPIRRRRSRSRSWSRSISYSRSRSRSRSPYYRYRSRSRSPVRRSLSRSPRPGTKYLNPLKRLSPRRRSISPRSRDYSPIRRRFSPDRLRRVSISPRRRSRSPYRSRPTSPNYSTTYRSNSPSWAPFSSSPPRSRKLSMSPRRRGSLVRSPRNSISPKRSAVPYDSLTRKRSKSPFSPSLRQRRQSLSPRRRDSPIKSARILISPKRRSFSPRRVSPGLKRQSVSPKRRLPNSPLRRSRSPILRRHSPLRKKSLSPLGDALPPFKHSRRFYPDCRGRPGSRSPFSRRPISPWKNTEPNTKRSSLSPRRQTETTKTRRVSTSPSKLTELKHRSLSPKRSPKRSSPRRNIQSPIMRRKSSSPNDRNIHRKSSPLVVRHRRPMDNRRPPHYRDAVQSGRPVSHHEPPPNRSKSRSLSPSTGTQATTDRNRLPFSGSSNNKDQINKRRGVSPQNYYSQQGYGQKRRRNFNERGKDRDNRRHDYRGRDRDRDRTRDGKERERTREKGRSSVNQKEKEVPSNKVEEKKHEEKVEEKNVITDPVLEARRRKFESNSPIQPVNKKIRLKTKTVTKETNPTEPTLDDIPIENEPNSSTSLRFVPEVNEEPSKTVDQEVKTSDALLDEIDATLRIMSADSSKNEEIEEPSPRIIRADSNKSLDKACNTDDVLELGDDGLLLMDDDEELLDYDEAVKQAPPPPRQQSQLRRTEPKKTAPHFSKIETRDTHKKKEIKQVKVKPLTRPNPSVDKACSPLVLKKKREEPMEEENLPDEEEQDNEDQRLQERELLRNKEKEEYDLRAQLSRRRAERLTKAGSVHESLPKRLVQSAFFGLGGKTRLDSKDKPRKPVAQVHSQVHVQPPPSSQVLRKERPTEGKRRVLLLNRSTTRSTKTAVQISFPKGLQPGSDSQSDSEEDDDDEDDDDVDDEQDDVEDEEEEEEETSIVLKDHKRNRRRLQRMPIQFRLGVTTGHCSNRRKVKLRHRKQVGHLSSIALDLHDNSPGQKITVDVTTMLEKQKKFL